MQPSSLSVQTGFHETRPNTRRRSTTPNVAAKYRPRSEPIRRASESTSTPSPSASGACHAIGECAVWVHAARLRAIQDLASQAVDLYQANPSLRGKIELTLEKSKSMCQCWSGLSRVRSVAMESQVQSSFQAIEHDLLSLGMLKSPGTDYRKDDEDLLELLEVIVSIPSDYAEALGLRGNAAANFMSALLKVLRGYCVGPSHPFLDIGVRMLRAIADTASLLPSSLHLRGITKDRAPVSSGGYADVYHASWVHGSSCVSVAVKTLISRNGSDSGDPLAKQLRAYRREVINWSLLSHPNLLTFFGCMEDGVSMVSEWIPNGNSSRFLRNNPDTDRLKLLVGVCAGLEYLHAVPMIHADLKPENILIRPNGDPCLCDFGVSKFLHQVPRTDSHDHGGSLCYQDPDAWEGKATLKSDIWSLALVTVEFFTGRIPWEKSRAFFTLMGPIREKKLRPQRPNSQAVLHMGFTDSVWHIVESCWAPRQSDRPSAAEVKLLMMECSRQFTGFQRGHIVAVQSCSKVSVDPKTLSQLGSSLNSIRERHNVRIKLDPVELEIIGYDIDVKAAKQHLQELIERKKMQMEMAQTPVDVAVAVFVPKRFHPQIIGVHGAGLKTFMERHERTSNWQDIIQFPSQDDPSEEFVLEGEESLVYRLKNALTIAVRDCEDREAKEFVCWGVPIPWFKQAALVPTLIAQAEKRGLQIDTSIKNRLRWDNVWEMESVGLQDSIALRGPRAKCQKTASEFLEASQCCMYQKITFSSRALLNSTINPHQLESELSGWAVGLDASHRPPRIPSSCSSQPAPILPGVLWSFEIYEDRPDDFAEWVLYSRTLDGLRRGTTFVEKVLNQACDSLSHVGHLILPKQLFNNIPGSLQRISQRTTTNISLNRSAGSVIILGSPESIRLARAEILSKGGIDKCGDVGYEL